MPDFPSEALPPQRSGWGTRSGKVGGRGKRGRMRNWGRYAKKKCRIQLPCFHLASNAFKIVGSCDNKTG